MHLLSWAKDMMTFTRSQLNFLCLTWLHRRDFLILICVRLLLGLHDSGRSSGRLLKVLLHSHDRGGHRERNRQNTCQQSSKKSSLQPLPLIKINEYFGHAISL